MPEMTDDVARETLELAGTDVVMGGHSHVAMIQHVGDKALVNAGTVGQPEDGDNRAQCIVIEDGAMLGGIAKAASK